MSAPTRARRIRVRRRPALIVAAVALGLAVLGGTAGAVLGAVGAASPDPGRELLHRGDHGPGPGPGPGRGR